MMGTVTLRRAVPEDARLFAETRRIVWGETYRGIYPDEMLDKYDVDAYAQRDRQRIENPQHHYYLYMDGENCVGYFSFGPYNFGNYKDFELCLNNLYIRNGYKGRGLGRQAFDVVRTHCRERGIAKFFCGCNIHNDPAMLFYRHMGGVPGDAAEEHENRADDIIHFEFHIGD